MPGTFSQIYIQIVFAVKGRENLISNNWKNELHKYIAGIVKSKGQKPIIINGMPDHIHAFVGLKPVMAISDLARDLKNNSSNFINERKLVKGKFQWQEARLTATGRGMAHFHILIRILIRFMIISSIRSNIIKRKCLNRNTSNF